MLCVCEWACKLHLLHLLVYVCVCVCVCVCGLVSLTFSLRLPRFQELVRLQLRNGHMYNTFADREGIDRIQLTVVYSHTPTHWLAHSLTHSHSLIHTHTHTHSLTHSLTLLISTHSLFLSLTLTLSGHPGMVMIVHTHKDVVEDEDQRLRFMIYALEKAIFQMRSHETGIDKMYWLVQCKGYVRKYNGTLGRCMV
jgi:hypothetical protein